MNAPNIVPNTILKIGLANKTMYFGIVRHDGLICWWRKTKTKGGTATVTTRINFLPRWKHRFIWSITQAWYHLTGREYMLCQGCGEGIAKFRIRDPNQGDGNERFNCCNDCVLFYDWRWSAMDIVGWKDKKPICKKVQIEVIS